MEVFKFSAEWCGPCKALKSTIEELGDVGIPIIDVNVDSNYELAMKYQVRGVPTLIKVQNGVEVARKSGSMTKEQLKEFLGV